MTIFAPARSRVFSPIMAAVRSLPRRRPVLGICNGFQILLECGLLPGAMLPQSRRPVLIASSCMCAWSRPTRRSPSATVGQVLRLPIAHGEGNYYAAPDVMAELEAKNRVVFRYVTPTGRGH